VVQPATPQYSGYSRRPARGQLGRRSPLCGPHLRGRTPAGTSERWSTPRQHRTPAGNRGPLLPVAALSSEQDRLHTIFRDPRLSSGDPRPGSRNRGPGCRFPSWANTEPTPCWYNRRYRARAQKYTQTCAYRQLGKPTKQTLSATHICSTLT
jgi:hypothetical protein